MGTRATEAEAAEIAAIVESNNQAVYADILAIKEQFNSFVDELLTATPSDIAMLEQITNTRKNLNNELTRVHQTYFPDVVATPEE